MASVPRSDPRGRVPEGADDSEAPERGGPGEVRKVTVEPVFGQIRTRGLVRFWLRGLAKVKAEWALWCTGHDLLKLFRSGALLVRTT